MNTNTENSRAAAAKADEPKEAKLNGNGPAPKAPGAELAEFAKSQEKKEPAKKNGGESKDKDAAKAERAAADAKLGGKGKKAKSKKASAKKPAAGKRAGSKKKGGAPRQGIGAFCESMLKQKKSTDEIMKAVQAKFPGAKTSPASIAWYRSKMREEGTLPKA